MKEATKRPHRRSHDAFPVSWPYVKEFSQKNDVVHSRDYLVLDFRGRIIWIVVGQPTSAQVELLKDVFGDRFLPPTTSYRPPKDPTNRDHSDWY